MSEISRATLFGKLNPIAYKAIESATVLCKRRGNPYVELGHWLHQILALQDSDLHRIVRAFDLDPDRLTRDITLALDRLPRGSSAISDLSSHVEEAVERGYVYGTLMFGETRVRTGHLFVGMLKTQTLRNALLALSKDFVRIRPDELCERFADLVAQSPERGLATPGEPGAPEDATAPDGAALPDQSKQDALKRFSVDLTERARLGEFDAVTGRDEEIRQIVDVLMRRRQNNPILTGEAGVGKTAVVEGFASRIARGDVPPPLRDVTLRALDIGLLQAGASMKGEFEQRLRQVIDEVQASTRPIILFIDEAHTLIGAGGAAGTGDAANLLKPALARGTLRTIAATTWAEYKKHIEKDPALTRRFQVVQVSEPSEPKAVMMMRALVAPLEKHHGVQILDEAVEAAVRLSHRYIPARQLPDKSVSLLDTACARVAIGLHAVPPAIEDCRRKGEALALEREIIQREQAVGIDIGDRASVAEQASAETEQSLKQLEARWTSEKALVERIVALRAELRASGAPPGGETAPKPIDRETLLGELGGLQAELAGVQGDHPLLSACVDAQAVADVVGGWTGIPVGRMVKNEIQTVLDLASLLGERVIGQSHALTTITRRIQTSRAELDNPNKPVGVFLLAGPSGVGKTETAHALAEALYGGDQNLITINMSEFQESHTVSTLKGAPPGYVGYGEGGILTEAVRRRPYSVVLLDEIEKAHGDVHEIFFQVFDKGWMEDGEGRRIDFTNTLILLTSNVGSDVIMQLCKNPASIPKPETLAQALREPLLEVFPAALLGRLVTVPYYPLSDAMLSAIVRLQLDRIVVRMEERHGVAMHYDDAVLALITSRCTELESGARMVDALLTNTLLPELSQQLLTRVLAGTKIAEARVSVEQGAFAYTLT